MKSESETAVTLAYCTFPDEATAARICQELVSEGTIRCANLLAPHRAIYEWNGQLENHPEQAALLKFASTNKTKLMEKIRAKHPYQVPALLFLEPSGGLPEFLNWICSQSP